MAGQLDRRFHESTSRAICRLSLLLLGGVPLLAAMVLAALQYVPTYHRWQADGWEYRLGIYAGFDIELAAVESLTPNRFVFHGLRVCHPENGVTVARVKKAEVERHRGQWLVRLEHPTFEGRRLADSWKLFHDSVLCRPLDAVAVVVAADELTVHSPVAENSLKDVLVKVLPGERESRLVADFQVSEITPGLRRYVPEPARVLCKRTHGENELQTHIQVQAWSTPLPCSLVQDFFPPAASLGDTATLQGHLDVYSASHGWDVHIGSRVSGRSDQANTTQERSGFLLMQQVDFGRLCWDAPAELTGTGGIRIDAARLSQSGIEQLKGAMQVGQGRISRELLIASQAYLGIALAPEVSASSRRDQNFDQLFFDFEISSAALQLHGAMPQGGLAARDNRLFAGRGKDLPPIPLGNLVSLFDKSPERTPDAVPQGRLAQGILQWFPRDSYVPKTARAEGVHLSNAQ